MFSRLTGKDNKSDAGKQLKAERVFESVHVLADRIGPILCITVVEESVTEREAGILYDETEAQLDDRCSGIVLNFRNVTVLTSAGIGTLVRLHKRIGERKGKLAVCSLSEDLAELFRITRMEKLFLVTTDQDAALGSLLK